MTEAVDLHMRPSDAFTWYMERDPLLRSTVVTVMLFDAEPDAERVRARFDRATRVVLGTRHHLVEPPLKLGPPRWVPDPNFDLSWHLRRIKIPAPETLAGLLDVARGEAMGGFDTARPLWNWTTVEGLEHGAAAGILKVHHSLTDGVGGMQLAAELFDAERDGAEPERLAAVAPERRGDPGVAAQVLDALRYRAGNALASAGHEARAFPGRVGGAITHPFGSASRAIATVRSIGRTVAPMTETRSATMRERGMSRQFAVLDVPIDDLKRAAPSGCTVNDAFLAAVTGGLRRYDEGRGAEPADLRVTMPISIRNDSDAAGGNRITLMRFAVPTRERDPVVRMHQIHALALASRAEPSIPLTNTIARTMNLLPNGFVGSMLKHVDFVASNVPGLAAPIYLGGARVTAIYPFGPTIGAALNVTLLSYCGCCNIGINLDTDAVEDPDAMAACLADGFHEVAERRS